MKINWFPGHMKKALREIKENLSRCDVIIYVLDSRAPLSSVNPSLSRLASGKPILYVFNKIDLADETRVKEIAKDFKGERSDFVILNSTMSGASKMIRTKLLSLAKDKIEKAKAKGIKTVVRAIVVGVPNSGKSTLVNNLCGKAKTNVGNRPGVTKTTQWLSIGDNIELCDTPGTLYPNLENQDIAKNLLFIGSIKDDIVADIVELAEEFLKKVDINYHNLLISRFGEELTIKAIAKKRGYILSKNELDETRTAFAILDDFRKGRIGRITLD